MTWKDARCLATTLPNGPETNNSRADTPATGFTRMPSKKREGLLEEGQMLDVEAAFIWGKPESKPEQLSGIALSGGGVRASVVALGVLQTLADQDLLSRFHYISTVSGGGYIGAALSWFWSSKRIQEERLPKAAPRFGCGRNDFPFQELEAGRLLPEATNYASLLIKDKAIHNLWFLRNHGSYLTSGDGVGFTALLIAIARTVVISLLVWMPVLIGFFWVIELLNKASYAKLTGYCDADYPARWCRNLEFFSEGPLYMLLLAGSLVAAMVFFLSVVTLALFEPARKERTEARISQRARAGTPYIVFGSVLMMMSLWYILTRYVQVATGALAVIATVGASWLLATGAAKFSVKNTSYFLRRGFDRWSYAVLPWPLVFLFLGAMPFIANHAPGLAEGSWLGRSIGGSLGGVIALLSGVATAIYGYYVKAKSILPGVAGQAFALTGSVLFLSGLLFFSFVVARHVSELRNVYADIAVLSLFLIALFLGFFSSVNATGLHRFYRDRLMETFMPMTEAIASGQAIQSDVADTLSLADMWDNKSPEKRPYHLVNTHAILIRDRDPKIALRGGENFLMSAAVVGSNATGWMKTSDYIDGSGPLTLASAMAASGAAANANAGYIGTGITRQRFVSAVMSTLNIRLGVWISNPRAMAKRNLTKRFKMTATYFGPALMSGILNLGNHREANYIEVSDGGHFENLGMYELVRRKASLILVVDAEQDGAINLSSLVSSTNRIKEDFGATIRFLESRGPELLIGQESHQYPGGVKIAKSPYIVGDIIYRDGSHGALVYIKATMITGLDFATDGYRASNPDFPHQTTVDQFFDPEQFEAYRDLGRKSCSLAVKELGLRGNPSPAEILKEYGFEKKLS